MKKIVIVKTEVVVCDRCGVQDELMQICDVCRGDFCWNCLNDDGICNEDYDIKICPDCADEGYCIGIVKE
ncbi:MAG: hypothetical protein HOG49_36560 [Candidatus Scalindua sp.]|nr:hypothetical protein [Candidatus Scalindua sp.]